MIRVVLENIIFLLLPTICYLVYVAFKRDDWPGLWKVLMAAPLLQLLMTGAALMVAMLFIFSSSSGHKPGEAYTPPSYHDGKVEPGHGNAGKP